MKSKEPRVCRRILSIRWLIEKVFSDEIRVKSTNSSQLQTCQDSLRTHIGQFSNRFQLLCDEMISGHSDFVKFSATLDHLPFLLVCRLILHRLFVLHIWEVSQWDPLLSLQSFETQARWHEMKHHQPGHSVSLSVEWVQTNKGLCQLSLEKRGLHRGPDLRNQ